MTLLADTSTDHCWPVQAQITVGRYKHRSLLAGTSRTMSKWQGAAAASVDDVGRNDGDTLPTGARPSGTDTHVNHVPGPIHGQHPPGGRLLSEGSERVAEGGRAGQHDQSTGEERLQSSAGSGSKGKKGKGGERAGMRTEAAGQRGGWGVDGDRSGDPKETGGKKRRERAEAARVLETRGQATAVKHEAVDVEPGPVVEGGRDERKRKKAKIKKES